MGLFFRKTPSSSTKSLTRSTISHTQTVLGRIDNANSPSVFYGSLDDLWSTLNQLRAEEKAGMKFTIRPNKIEKEVKGQLTELERKFIDRAFERVGMEAAKLSTEKGKANKYMKFFSEMEYYRTRMKKENYAYLCYLEDQISIRFNGS